MEAVVHSPQPTFVNALRQSAHPSLYSSREKHLLLGLCAGVFVLPLLLSVLVLKKSPSSVSLKVDPDQVAYLQKSNLAGANDELAMVEIFLQKAAEALDSAQKQRFLSEAQALAVLVPTTPENLPRLEMINQQLAAVTTVGNMPQRIAAPAPDGGTALSLETTSNANSKSVTMLSGTRSLFVPYPQLQDKAQIYLTLPGNRSNAVVYVSTRENGKGFTLASTSLLVQDIKVTWYEIIP